MVVEQAEESRCNVSLKLIENGDMNAGGKINSGERDRAIVPGTRRLAVWPTFKGLLRHGWIATRTALGATW